MDTILKDLDIKIDCPQLSEEELLKLKQLICKHRDVFAKSILDMPGTDVLCHKIETGDAPPQRRKQYRLSMEAQAEVRRQVQEMLDAGQIRESNSAWNAPVILVKKKDATYRFVVDYRSLNSVTKVISFAIPTMNDILDAVADGKPIIFSSLDLKSGYHQVKIDESSKEKTAFSTNHASYEWNVMPFGLSGAPATFQRLMHSVMRGAFMKYLICYIDDCLIYSRSVEEHLQHLEEVFLRLKRNKLRLHPSKCVFGRESVLYLGHILPKDRVYVDQ